MQTVDVLVISLLVTHNLTSVTTISVVTTNALTSVLSVIWFSYLSKNKISKLGITDTDKVLSSVYDNSVFSFV